MPQPDDTLFPERLERYLQTELGRPNDALRVERFAGEGRSNITAFISFGRDSWVIRRPPPGELLPTAHDVAREYRFQCALAPTDVPVPTPVLLCEDPSVIGAPFYLMEPVSGIVIDNELPPELDTAPTRRSLCESMIDTLADLHSTDWRRSGLSEQPGDFLQRQIHRWSRQLELTPTATRVPELATVTEWLVKNAPPASPSTIVHGDFDFPNVMFSPGPTVRARAVLDWEMATVGDPLTDLMWFLRDWDVREPFTWTASLKAALTSKGGALTGAEMIVRYEQARAIEVRNTRFYAVLAWWKEAAISEGLYAAYLEGNSPNDENARYASEVPAVVAHMLQLIDEATEKDDGNLAS